MNVLFTVIFTVVCPNEQFTSFKTNLSYSEALAEIEYFKANPTDDLDSDDSDPSKCIIVSPKIESQSKGQGA